MIAIENRGSSLTKAIAITSQTIHVTCTPRLAATGVVTGVSVTYSGAAAVLMVFAALWNFVMSCVTKRHFKRNDGDKLNERELATKMLMNRSTMRGSGGRGELSGFTISELCESWRSRLLLFSISLVSTLSRTSSNCSASSSELKWFGESLATVLE